MHGGSSPWKGTRRVTQRDESSVFLPWQVSQLQSHPTVSTPSKCPRFQEGFSSFIPCCSQSHPDFSLNPAVGPVEAGYLQTRQRGFAFTFHHSNTEVSSLAQITSGAGSLTAGQQLSPNKPCTALAATHFVGSTNRSRVQQSPWRMKFQKSLNILLLHSGTVHPEHPLNFSFRHRVLKIYSTADNFHEHVFSNFKHSPCQ